MSVAGHNSFRSDHCLRTHCDAVFGTRGTLILRGESEAYLFDEGGTGQPAMIEATPRGSGPALEASESRAADAAGRAGSATTDAVDRLVSYRREISAFCAAIRVGAPLACGPERAVQSAMACLRADEAIQTKARRPIRIGTSAQSARVPDRRIEASG